MRFLDSGTDDGFDATADGHIFDSLVQALGTGGPAMRMLVRKWRRGLVMEIGAADTVTFVNA